MKEQYVIIKHTQGFEWKSKQEICIADSYELAMQIIAHLKVYDEPEKDEDGSDAQVEYWATRRFVFTRFEDFVEYWEE
jgi:hypothetical protein